MLVGGAGRRMGADKARVDVDGRPLAALAARGLVRAGTGAVLLVGGAAGEGDDLVAAVQRALAADAAGPPPAVCAVPDGWPGEGPLGGIASALAAAPRGSRVLVVACDQPDLGTDLLAGLVGALADPAVGVAVPRTADGRRHPFPSAWRQDRAPLVAEVLAGGARRADAAWPAAGLAEVAAGAEGLVDLDTPEALAAWRGQRPRNL